VRGAAATRTLERTVPYMVGYLRESAELLLQPALEAAGYHATRRSPGGGVTPSLRGTLNKRERGYAHPERSDMNDKERRALQIHADPHLDAATKAYLLAKLTGTYPGRWSMQEIRRTTRGGITRRK
jgi:hypothetical protein